MGHISSIKQYKEIEICGNLACLDKVIGPVFHSGELKGLLAQQQSGHNQSSNTLSKLRLYLPSQRAPLTGFVGHNLTTWRGEMEMNVQLRVRQLAHCVYLSVCTHVPHFATFTYATCSHLSQNDHWFTNQLPVCILSLNRTMSTSQLELTITYIYTLPHILLAALCKQHWFDN